MQKYNKIYKVASIVNLCIHIVLFILIVAVSFLPFRENQNFYGAFTGFFGARVEVVHPYLILSLLLLACVCALFAIKHPALSCVVLIFTFAFFAIMIFPYVFEAAFVGFSSPWIGTSMSSYHIGFDYMNRASNVIYFDFAFTIYSLVTLFIRHIRANT